MGQKVLVFESDATFAADLRNELTKLGCSVQVVDDGNTGLQQATTLRPDLILLSIELPRMNGFSVCNKLKKDPSLKDVPLIIMSTESSEETFEQHRKLRTRAEDYVHKPIVFGELLARIQPFVSLQATPPSAVDSATGLPPPQANWSDIEELDGDIVIDDMNSLRPVSRPPADSVRASRPATSIPPPSADLIEHVNGNGSESLEAALRAAREAPLPRISERPARASTRAPSGDDGSVALAEGLQRDVEAAHARIRGLEEALDRADAERVRSDASRADDGALAEEVERLRKDNEDLRTRISASGSTTKSSGISSREFLDLREALNKKDKEILSFREGFAKKDKELVDVRDRSLAFERQKADLDDKVLEQERELADRQDKIESLQADKDQAKKAGDDFKRRSERAQADTESVRRDLVDLRERQAQALDARVAEIAEFKALHAVALEEERTARAAAAAEAEQLRTREHEEAAGEKQRALEDAQRVADEASRELEIARTSEHEARLEASRRAHAEETQRLQAIHARAVDAWREQESAAAVSAASAKEAALASLRSELEAERTEALEALDATAKANAAALQEEASVRLREAKEAAANRLAAVERDATAVVAAALTRTAEAENVSAERVAAAERESSAQLVEAANAAKDAERSASARVAAAERDAAEQIAAAVRDANERVMSAQRETVERLAAAEDEASQKLEAVEASAVEKIAALETLASATLSAAETAASAQAEVASREAAMALSATEQRASAQRDALDARIAELASHLETARIREASLEQHAFELDAQLGAMTLVKGGIEKELEAAMSRLVTLEADFAAARYSLDETKIHLVTQTSRLEKVSAKIEADKTSLDRAKDALAVALSQIEEAESRSVS